jgi:hypothetical protein
MNIGDVRLVVQIHSVISSCSNHFTKRSASCSAPYLGDMPKMVKHEPESGRGQTPGLEEAIAPVISWDLS